MTYPKPMMSIKEIHITMGVPLDFLKQAVHVPGQTFASKTSGGGKWLIDTEEFEKWRRKRKWSWRNDTKK